MKILLIHPEGNVNYNANLLGLIEILAEAGHRVTYAAPRIARLNQALSSSAASVELVDRLPTHGRFLLPRWRAALLPWVAPDFSRWRGHDLVLAVDRGTIEGARIARHFAIPHALLSYEIFFREETSAGYKAPEIEACRDLAFAVCQDELRARHLCEQNVIAPKKVLRIPVAGRGARIAQSKPRALHAMFGLAPEVKTVLHMGSFADWTHAPFLLESTRHWPEDWALVVHERYGLSSAARDLVRRHADQRRVHMSGEAFVDPDAMSAFIQSADLGVALYHPTYDNHWVGRNIEHIGLASGKISSYLQHGVPVATHDLGEIAALIRSYGAGQVFSVDRPFIPEVPTPAHIEGARRLFAERLDLNRFAAPLLERVSSTAQEA